MKLAILVLEKYMNELQYLLDDNLKELKQEQLRQVELKNKIKQKEKDISEIELAIKILGEA